MAAWTEYAPLRRLGKLGRRALTAADQLVWPRRSLMTGEMVAGPGLIEAEHWRRLSFLTGAHCRSCGTPFEIPIDAGQVCAACVAHPPAFDRARAALAYDEVSRELILPLKHGGRRDGLALLAGWMHLAARDLCEDADMIAPTPLHYRRLARRGFNQAGWLAAALARECGGVLSVDLLKRVRATPSQAGKSARGRRRNVAGAFKVRRGRRIEGRRILLVDDVLTTGATADACAKALKRAGAAAVDVVAAARVVGPNSPPV